MSSTLISIPGGGNLLLDCGEGTWGQLVRLFGDDPACSSGVWEELRKLKCIFLSHVHGDHHIGVAKLLAMRKKVCDRLRQYARHNVTSLILAQSSTDRADLRCRSTHNYPLSSRALRHRGLGSQFVGRGRRSADRVRSHTVER